MFEWLRARRAAKRLGLRDRGRVDAWYMLDTHSNSMVPIEIRCERCACWIRIGINKEEKAVQYCWRCVEIISNRKDKNRVYLKMSMSRKAAWRMQVLMEECRIDTRGKLFDLAINLFSLCVKHTKKGNQIWVADSDGNPLTQLEFGRFKFTADEGWRIETTDKEEPDEDSEVDEEDPNE